MEFIRSFGIAVLAGALLFGSLSASAYSDEYATPKTWLEGYRPNYFLYGNPDSKIQLSAKVQLLEDHRLYFAYSQTMFWDIGYVSSPITDVNFNPELFYRFELSGPGKVVAARDLGPADDGVDQPFSGGSAPDDAGDGAKTWLDLGILEHESNGEVGAASRSWNRSYVRYVLESRYDNDVRVYSSFKAWVPFTGSFDVGNADLLYYRGLYEVELTCANLLGDGFSRSDLTLKFFSGGPSHVNPFSGGQELTFRFARRSLVQFVPLWTLQVFNGYGEDLLHYSERRTIFRAGLSF